VANIKSSIRSIKLSLRNRRRNLSYLNRIKKIIRDLKRTPSIKLLNQAISLLDKLALKKIIHRNKAARQKSQLMKKYSKAK
jgi:small subunit ribosomal protein S20